MSKEQNRKKTGGMKYHNGFFVGISFGNMRAHVFDTKCMEKEKNGLDFFLFYYGTIFNKTFNFFTFNIFFD